MDFSKIKGITQRIFKDYSSLLLPTAIGLVAALLFVPTQLMSNRLRGRIAAESISKGDMLRSLRISAVPGEQWKEERDYQRAHASDADEIGLLARQATQRELLSYAIFPEPKDKSTQIFEKFGEQFCEAVEQLITRVNARDCPTEAELDRSLQRTLVTRRRRRRSSYGRLRTVDASIRDDLCREKAESASVYVNPADLPGYEFWGEYKYADAGTWDDAVKECWYSQLGYWIVEDVVDTVGAVDSGSNCVLTSPVKRLLRVSFAKRATLRASRYGSKRRSGQTKNDKPSYVLDPDEGATVPCTGRICNQDVDVVHFSVSVVADTEAVLPFMQELCSAKQHDFEGWHGEISPSRKSKHNQIAILEYGIASVDCDDDEHFLYRYGESAVVQLDLICEYIFDRDGYDEVKPEVVKKSVEESLKELQDKRAKAARRMPRPQSSTSTGPKKEGKTGRGKSLSDIGM